MTTQGNVPKSIDVLVRPVCVYVLLLGVFDGTFEVIVQNYSFVVTGDKVAVCE